MTKEANLLQEQVKFLMGFSLRNYGYRIIGYSTYQESQNHQSTFVVAGQRDLRHPEWPVTSETIFDTASVAKQFTAATLLKLWDNEIAANQVNNFPNGIDTPINHFMDSLQEKYPQCRNFFSEVKKKPQYQKRKITLRDLLNHTHSLGIIDHNKFNTISEQSPDKPMELYEALNSAIDVASSDNHGKYNYFQTSNIGIELAAMIIEVITDKSYDDALKETILEPYGLNKIYTQSEVKNKQLFNEKFDIARTCANSGIIPLNAENKIALHALPALEADSVSFDPSERSRDYKGAGRAAVKLRVTLDNLAKFGRLFMTAEMFESQVIKQELLNFPGQKAVRVDELDVKNPKFYNLCIDESEFEQGFIGHTGGTQFTEMHLKYNPSTKEINVAAFTAENVTNNFAIMVLRKISTLDERKKLVEFIKETKEALLLTDSKNFKIDDYAKDLMSSITPREEQLTTFQEAAKQNPQACKLFNKLRAIHQDILEFPIESLMDSKTSKEIIDHLVEKAQKRDDCKKDIWVEKTTPKNSDQNQQSSR